ncbi:MAG TPA: KH domain-containing protein [Anaerolineae bacterium]|nr:KH domain-containing protein [Anaerolineae bacterium]
MRDLLEYVVRSLVDDPSGVSVKESRSGNTVIFELHVAPEDAGRVIGKNGRVANSIRSLLRVAAAKEGMRVQLDIL